jgi:hypothetical protein
MMVWGLIYKYAKMVLLPPQLPHPLHYLIGLEAKDPSFHASPPSSPPSSTTTSNPRLPVLIMPLIVLYDYNAFSRWFGVQNINFFIFSEWFEGENHV